MNIDNRKNIRIRLKPLGFQRSFYSLNLGGAPERRRKKSLFRSERFLPLYLYGFHLHDSVALGRVIRVIFISPVSP